MTKEEILNHQDLYKMIRWAMHKLGVPIKNRDDLEQEVVLRIMTHSFDEKSKMSTIILRRTAWTIGDLKKQVNKSAPSVNSPLVVEGDYKDKFGYIDEKDKLNTYLNSINEKEKFVLQQYYLAAKTDTEIAKKLNITHQRVQQLRCKHVGKT